MSKESLMREAVQHKNALGVLVNSEGWQIMRKVMAERAAAYSQTVSKPISDMAQLYAQEFNKGAAVECNMLMVMPEAMLDSAQQTIDNYKRTQPNADNEETS